MKKLTLKSIKKSLSRDEMRAIQGGGSSCVYAPDTCTVPNIPCLTTFPIYGGGSKIMCSSCCVS